MVATARRCKSPTNELLVIFYAEFVKQKSSDVVVPVYADNFLTFVLSLSLSLCVYVSLSSSWDIFDFPLVLHFTVSLICHTSCKIVKEVFLKKVLN